MPGLAVHVTFSPARARRSAVVARLARTLGLGGRAQLGPSRSLSRAPLAADGSRSNAGRARV
jgi:hypothetical protein